MEPLRGDDPRRVGSYRLQGRLGAGGMGQVYLAKSPSGRRVALKMVHPEFALDAEFRQRFEREVAAARRVGGAFTAPVVDADPLAEHPWLATVYVAGPSLRELVRRDGPLPERDVWRLAAGLAEALRAVHAAGIVHRDLKPANVLMSDDGPRVIDFGISLAAEGTVLTRSGIIQGTPMFMSPEQVEGGEIGPASDVFSLGCLLLWAATDAPPFGTGSPTVLLYRIVKATPSFGGVTGELREVIEACLAKDPAGRPTVEELLDRVNARLERYGDTSGHVPVVSIDRDPEGETNVIAVRPVPGSVARPRRRRGLLAGAAAVLALVVSLGAWAFAGRSDGRHHGVGAAAIAADCRQVAIGYLGQLSHDVTTMGREERDGVESAVDAYNVDHADCPVLLRKYDTYGQPDRAARLARQAVADTRLLALVGPTFTDELTAVGPVVSAAGLATATPSATAAAPANAHWTSVRWALADDAAQGRAIVADLDDAQRVFVLDDTGRRGGFAAAVTAALGDRAVRLRTVGVTGGDPVAEIRAERADAVVCDCRYPVLGRVLARLQAAGVGTTVYGGDRAFDVPYQTVNPPSETAWVRYAGVHEIRRNHFRDVAGDLATMMLNGIDAGARTRPALLNYLDTTQHEGAAGRYRFGTNGRAKRGPGSVWSIDVEEIPDAVTTPRASPPPWTPTTAPPTDGIGGVPASSSASVPSDPVSTSASAQSTPPISPGGSPS